MQIKVLNKILIFPKLDEGPTPPIQAESVNCKDSATSSFQHEKLQGVMNPHGGVFSNKPGLEHVTTHNINTGQAANIKE